MERNESDSKKPSDSDFQQQRLKAWQPLLTPNWVIGTFLIIGLIFIPIGVIILVYSNQVVEIESRYDHLYYDASIGQVYPSTCPTSTLLNSVSNIPLNTSSAGTCLNRFPSVNIGSGESCLPLIDDTQYGHNHSACEQTLYIPITKDMKAPVFVYYKLSNYYQNHRRYVKSRSDAQLRGDSNELAPCDPIKKTVNISGGIATPMDYYPCGLIATTVFSDTFSGDICRPGNGVNCNDATAVYSSLGTYNGVAGNPLWQKEGIAWESDKKDKFRYNYAYSIGSYHKSLLGYTMPRVDDEDFIVWMRTAGLPTFKKLYRKINMDLVAGDVLRIKYINSYPVKDFNGEKAIVISTTSWLGGKNTFLAWAYIIVGIVCIVLALIFLVKHCTNPRPLGDMKYFNWPGQRSARPQM